VGRPEGYSPNRISASSPAKTNDAGFGHVFESSDGAATWTDISSDLPDVPGGDLVLVNGRLVVAMDLGVYTAAAGGGVSTSWSRFGTGLPNSSVNLNG
jgi:hypothetical protein